jgi:hypothetical protein
MRGYLSGGSFTSMRTRLSLMTESLFHLERIGLSALRSEPSLRAYDEHLDDGFLVAG